MINISTYSIMIDLKYRSYIEVINKTTMQVYHKITIQIQDLVCEQFYEIEDQINLKTQQKILEDRYE